MDFSLLPQKLIEGGVTYILSVGRSVSSQCKLKDKGIDFCLVNGTGHYFWSTINGTLYFQGTAENQS